MCLNRQISHVTKCEGRMVGAEYRSESVLLVHILSFEVLIKSEYSIVDVI